MVRLAVKQQLAAGIDKATSVTGGSELFQFKLNYRDILVLNVSTWTKFSTTSAKFSKLLLLTY
eukprot:SAG11_NODE_1991_length_3957_cov_2.906169_1_plen_63_part_00